MEEIVQGLGFISTDSYLFHMRAIGTYGDYLTLRSIARLFNIRIRVVSTLGVDGTVFITPDGQDCLDLPLISLDHLQEGSGEHYVSLKDSSISSDSE